MWVKHPISSVLAGGSQLVYRGKADSFVGCLFWEINQGSISMLLSCEWWEELHKPKEAERALR